MTHELDRVRTPAVDQVDSLVDALVQVDGLASLNSWCYSVRYRGCCSGADGNSGEGDETVEEHLD
jgi:hypothetical protein